MAGRWHCVALMVIGNLQALFIAPPQPNSLASSLLTTLYPLRRLPGACSPLGPHFRASAEGLQLERPVRRSPSTSLETGETSLPPPELSPTPFLPAVPAVPTGLASPHQANRFPTPSPLTGSLKAGSSSPLLLQVCCERVQVLGQRPAGKPRAAVPIHVQPDLEHRHSTWHNTSTDHWMSRRQASSSHTTGIPKGENRFRWVWGPLLLKQKITRKKEQEDT